MASPPQPDFASLIARVSDSLSSHGIPHMLIGGQAMLLHGRPRLTEDIDFTLGVSADRLDTLLKICSELALDVLPEEVSDFVNETNVLPARAPDTAIRIDFIFSSLPYELGAIDRAVVVKVEDTDVPFASAEDLILHKLFAGRALDIEDARSVVRRQREHLDWDYITRWAEEFSEIPGREGIADQIGDLRR